MKVALLYQFVHTQGLNKLYSPAVNYIFPHVFNKMYPGWLDVGCIKVPGDSVMVCAWGCHFSLHERGLEHPLWDLCSEQLLPLSWPGACTDIPTKTDHDIIRALCGDDWHHMVMSQWCGGFWMMTFMSVLKGYKKEDTQEDRGSRFKFWAHRVKLASSRVLQCISALG